MPLLPAPFHVPPLKLNPHFSPCGWRAWGHRAHHPPSSVILGGSSRAVPVGGSRENLAAPSRPWRALKDWERVQHWRVESGSQGHTPQAMWPLPTPTGGHLQTLPESMINCRLWGRGRARNV